MSKPILYSIVPFDKSNSQVFEFYYSGVQAKSNTLQIYNNSTSDLVYEETQITSLLKHVLPKNTLTNGITYYAQVQVTDVVDYTSGFSDPLVFDCLSIPIFSLNINTNDIIYNSYINVELTYSQYDGELLDSWYIVLYDVSHNPLYSTDISYETDPEDLVATISGLSDNTQYYIRAYGETVNGVLLDTGDILFSVEYIQPESYSLLQLENLADQGMIKISNNLQCITGVPSLIGEDGEYHDFDKFGSATWGKYINNSELILNNYKIPIFIVYNNGFSITSDGFTSMCKARDFIFNKSFHMFGNNIELLFARGQFEGQVTEKAYCLCKVYNSFSSYVIKSNYIDVPLETDYIFIWLRKSDDNLYSLKIENLGGGS